MEVLAWCGIGMSDSLKIKKYKTKQCQLDKGVSLLPIDRIRINLRKSSTGQVDDPSYILSIMDKCSIILDLTCESTQMINRLVFMTNDISIIYP